MRLYVEAWVELSARRVPNSSRPRCAGGQAGDVSQANQLYSRRRELRTRPIKRIELISF